MAFMDRGFGVYDDAALARLRTKSALCKNENTMNLQLYIISEQTDTLLEDERTQGNSELMTKSEQREGGV